MGLLDYVKYRLWAAQQYPDPDLIHKYGGLFSLTGYLRSCASPDLTKDILRRYGAKIHPDAFPVGPWVVIHEAIGDFSNLEVGAHSHIGKEVFLDLTDKIIIGEGVALGMRATVLTHLNVGEWPGKPTAKLIPKKQAPTIIEKGASIGAHSVILCGVRVGAFSVINAGCVVDRDVPPCTIVTSSEYKAPYQMPVKLFRKYLEK